MANAAVTDFDFDLLRAERAGVELEGCEGLTLGGRRVGFDFRAHGSDGLKLRGEDCPKPKSAQVANQKKIILLAPSFARLGLKSARSCQAMLGAPLSTAG